MSWSMLKVSRERMSWKGSRQKTEPLVLHSFRNLEEENRTGEEASASLRKLGGRWEKTWDREIKGQQSKENKEITNYKQQKVEDPRGWEEQGTHQGHCRPGQKVFQASGRVESGCNSYKAHLRWERRPHKNPAASEILGGWGRAERQAQRNWKPDAKKPQHPDGMSEWSRSVVSDSLRPHGR